MCVSMYAGEEMKTVWENVFVHNIYYCSMIMKAQKWQPESANSQEPSHTEKTVPPPLQFLPLFLCLLWCSLLLRMRDTVQTFQGYAEKQLTTSQRTHRDLRYTTLSAHQLQITPALSDFIKHRHTQPHLYNNAHAQSYQRKWRKL